MKKEMDERSARRNHKTGCHDGPQRSFRYIMARSGSRKNVSTAAVSGPSRTTLLSDFDPCIAFPATVPGLCPELLYIPSA
jgi:hypothetical protein